MKARASLLIAFMIVVPAAAMFSHRIPADVRRSMRECSSRLVASWTGGRPDARPTSPQTATDGPSAAEALSAADAGASATAAAVVSRADADGRSAAPPVRRAEDSLEALGVVGLECRPLAGGVGHMATCSVPLDASGQLFRVFHATGPDGNAAVETLAADIAAWRTRSPSRVAATVQPETPRRRF